MDNLLLCVFMLEKGFLRDPMAENSLVPWSQFDELMICFVRIQGQAQTLAARSVDEILTIKNWLIGAWIIAYEQEGADRARYGNRLLESIAEDLKKRSMGGFSVSNLKNYRQIALTWPTLIPSELAWGESVPTTLPTIQEDFPWHNAHWMQRLRTELSFSHLLELSRINDPLARAFYEVETLKNRWSLRELHRYRNSLLYERVGLSRDKEALMALTQEGRTLETPQALIRDPYVLEFLGLEGKNPPTEEALEAELLKHLEAFLLELGRDFCFMGRQFRITVGGRHHFIDLLFYHRRLRCLVAIDLKIGNFGYEHAGQMNFYLNYLRENVAQPEENPPIGLILCAGKDSAEVRYAFGGLEQNIFVSRYLIALPTESQLQKWLLEEQEAMERIRQTVSGELK